MNVHGVLAAARALVRPGLLVPNVEVPSEWLYVLALTAAIADLDWRRVHDAGVRFLVFDKDNCLTVPHKERLVPELSASWEECKRVFGRDNILIVSNSSGTRKDPLGVDVRATSGTFLTARPRTYQRRLTSPCCATAR